MLIHYLTARQIFKGNSIETIWVVVVVNVVPHSLLSRRPNWDICRTKQETDIIKKKDGLLSFFSLSEKRWTTLLSKTVIYDKRGVYD